MSSTAVAAPLLVPLDGHGCNAASVGGKAAGLDRLAAHGFPVPAAAALTVAAYHQYVAAAGLETYLDEVAAAPIPEADRLEAEVAEIDRRFLETPLPAVVAEAVHDAAASLLAAGAVAVRSSATAEDLGIASFAGQYVSFVGVADQRAVERAVRLCWASLWRPAARAYRRHAHIDQTALGMGVVIQSMVEADWSGVAFTRDPGHRGNVMRIEVVPGLGEGLVSGRVTPDDFVVRRDTLAMCGAGGATPPVFMEDLARLLLQVESQLDQPQDVEWAVVGDTLTLLQARPITVAGPTTAHDDGFDGPSGSSDAFTPRGVVEMLPGVVSPLVWTINAPMIENGFRNVAARLGDVHLGVHRPFLGRFGGRAALNLSALRDLAADLPGGSAAEVEYQFLGHSTTEEREDRPRKGAGVREALRVRRAQREVADEVELCRASARAIVALEVRTEDLPAVRLLAYRRTVRDLAWRLVAAEIAASSAAAAAYRGLELILRRWCDDDEAALWAQRLTAGAMTEDAVGVQLSRRLHGAIRRGVSSAPGLQAALAARPGRRALQRVAQLGSATVDFRREVDEIIRSQGSRAVYGGATWAESPELVWDQIAVQASLGARRPRASSPEVALDELVRALRASRSWRWVRIVTGQVVDLRVRWIRQQVAQATRFLRLREQAKSALLMLGGEERRITLDAAKRCVASGQLTDLDDVELLADGELAAMVLGAASPPEPTMFRRRTVRTLCEQRPTLPPVFVGDPQANPPAAVPDGAVLRGWAASPGLVEGRARVVTNLGEGAAMRDGEILVARATDPSWTPLLLAATGLVLEEGGPLSHGAIVAREFGLPAVLNVADAVSIIQPGEHIEVDGFAGVVRRIGAPEEVAAP